MPGGWELLAILAVVILIFGAGRLKTLGADLGGAIKGFRKSMAEEEQKTEEATQDTPSANQEK